MLPGMETTRRKYRKAVHVATRIEYDVREKGLEVVPGGEDIRFPCGHPAPPRALTKPCACFACPATTEDR